MQPPLRYIETVDALADLSRELATEPSVALDTEFVWDRTYHPQLGLVQIATASGMTALVDTVAVPDLSPLGPLLASPDCVKILHDAQQDLVILRRATGAFPRGIFDTRLAAGFAGRSAEQSLQALLQTVLDIDLPKGLARSDWRHRPLAPELLAYAQGDVLHLHRLRDALLREADALGNSARLAEELDGLEAPGLYTDPKPRRQYERVRGTARLDPTGLAILRELTAWRERRAREADRPRRWILPDNALIELAARPPDSESALARCKHLPARTRQREGGTLLACVRKGLAVPPARRPSPAPSTRPRPEDRERVEACFHALQARARTLRIDPFLVTTRAELTRHLAGEPGAHDGRLALGWRRDLFASVRNDDPEMSHRSGNAPPPATSDAPA